MPRFGVAGTILLAVGLSLASGGFPAARAQTLPEALDASWQFTTGGDAAWFGQTGTKMDGVDAAQVDLGPGKTSWLETTRNFAGGYLTFSETIDMNLLSNDTLTVFVDNQLRRQATPHPGSWHWHDILLSPGVHTIRWEYTTTSGGGSMGGSCWVDDIVMQPEPGIGAAIDVTDYPISTGGDADWESQGSTTHDGIDAAQSRDIGDNQSSLFEVTRTFEAGFVGFWWKVSSEDRLDFSQFPPRLSRDVLKFSIDGNVLAAMAGNRDWELVSFPISAGSHTLRWEYAKNGSFSSGSDCGWVDQLVVGELPMVTLSATAPTAAEAGATPGTFTVSRTGDPTLPLTVSYIAAGTATAGSDYTTLPGVVTIPGGASTATISVAPLDDATGEDSETALVALTAGTLYLLAAPSSATVTITSDDAPAVTIVASDATATEAGTSPGSFTVTRTAPLEGALTVDYLLSGTAAAGTDYAASPGVGSVIIPASSASATITITPVDDSDFEDDETVVATLSPGAAYSIQGTGSDRLDIVSDDLPVIGLAEAADQPALSFTTAGGSPWFGQGTTTRDGVDACQSGGIGNDQASSLETVLALEQPTEIGFWWKIASEAGHDFLSFRIDGVERATISGAVDWEQRSFTLAAGMHTLSWSYAKDGSGSSLDDAAWVDQLEIRSIRVTYPSAPGIVKPRGRAMDIVWASVGAQAPAVKIELFKGVSMLRTIADSTEDDGLFSWTIPAGQTAGTDYKVKVTALSDPAASDTSDAFFTISGGPMLTVQSPNLPGVGWKVGSSYTVKWKKAGTMGSSVGLALFKGAAKLRTVAAATPNDGRFSWRIPALPAGADYRIQVKSRSSRKVWDFSNEYFSIGDARATGAFEEPGPSIASTRDARYRIVWDSAVFPGPAVSVELWRGGEPFLTLAPSETNDGSLEWPVPETLDAGEDYRFRLRSIADPKRDSFSEKPFRLGVLPREP